MLSISLIHENKAHVRFVVSYLLSYELVEVTVIGLNLSVEGLLPFYVIKC